jgi:predicted ATPase/DNA-binding XRE family transcriptional regulator
MTATDNRQRTPSAPFSQLLKRLRVSADLTQEELAERAGVSARLVSDLERGLIRRPRRDTVQMLAGALQLAGAARDGFTRAARGRPDEGEPAGSAALSWRASLPLPPAALVGREREIAAATSLLLQQEVRLLTLTGPGGVGKTRLAIDAAAEVVEAFPHGAIFIDLAPLTDPALVLATIARTLGVRDSGETPLMERLIASLQGPRLLVVLDNVEHLVAAGADLAHLLAACAGLTVLATSRQPLHLRVERVYPVAPLALPDLRSLPRLDELGRVPAIELFVRRAEAARPTFALTAANARAVAEIAVRLDGLPLAIELAAARIKILSPDELLARLERRLPLLTGGANDLPARLRTLRATIEWSYALLPPVEQAVFRQLAVFAGGCILETAEAVAGRITNRTHHTAAIPAAPSTAFALLDTLASLVDKNLLRAIEQPDDDSDRDVSRFGMLETIREYGLDLLAAAGEEVEVRGLHAAWCLTLAEQAEPELRGPEQAQWLARLDAEHDNLRAALSWALSQRDAATALRLAGALRRFWTIRGHYAEGRRWLDQALALDDVPPAVRARALLAAGSIAYSQGDYEQAAAHCEEALALYRVLGDLAGVAAAYRLLGMVVESLGDRERSAALEEEALRLYRVLGDRSGIGGMLNSIGLATLDRGDCERAAVLLEEALALARESGTSSSIAVALNNLAFVALVQGHYERATARQAEALELYRLQGHQEGLAHCYENFASIAAGRNEPVRAARLAGAAEALRVRIGAPGRPSDRDFNERHFAKARAQFGEAAFDSAWAEGRAMSPEEAIAYALEGSRACAPSNPRHARSGG